MPSIKCTCGHIFGTGSFPTQNAYMAISEQDYDDLGKIEDIEVLDRLLFSSTRMYQCKECSEWIVFWNGASEPEYFKKN